MEMTGEYHIPAPRQQVWEALNDIDILRQCIPGCEGMQRLSDDEIEATVAAKVGPVRAKFKGSVSMTNLNPPESYTLSGSGKGGAAGFAKGSADVTLHENGNETTLNYVANAQVGGKLAQLGSRLIDGTARKMADDFFARFSELAAGGAPAAPEEAATAEPSLAEPAAEAAEKRPALNPWIWVPVLIIIIALGLWFYTS